MCKKTIFLFARLGELLFVLVSDEKLFLERPNYVPRRGDR